jgi:hypothetical protein
MLSGQQWTNPSVVLIHHHQFILAIRFPISFCTRFRFVGIFLPAFFAPVNPFLAGVFKISLTGTALLPILTEQKKISYQ